MKQISLEGGGNKGQKKMKEVEINLKTSSLFFFFFFVHSRKSFKCMSYSHFNDSHTLGVYIQLTTRHNSI